MRDKHVDKPLKCICPKCDETFHQKSQLDKHLNLHSPTFHVCTVCNKTYAKVYRLKRHMIIHNESTDLRKFKCPECGKAFKFKHHLKEHVRMHSGEKPFVCNNCGKRFSHSGSFSSHKKSKRCRGISSTQKGRVSVGSQDSAQNLTHHLGPSPGLKLPVTFANTNPNAAHFQRTPLQNVPVTMAHEQHFIPNPYSQQKGILSFYYPPQLYASSDGFMHPVFFTNQLVVHRPPGLGLSGLQGLKRDTASSSEDRERSPSVSRLTSLARSVRSISSHSQSTRSFSPHSYSGCSLSPQSSAYSLASPNPNLAHRGSTPSSVSHDATPVADRSTPVRDRSTPVADRIKESSPMASSEQISPDVSKHSKLLMVKKEYSGDDKDHATAADQEADSSASDQVDSSVRDDSIDEGRGENGDPCRRTCQYCHEIFESPVAHYQHERYMCKPNKDLWRKPESCQSPHSTMSDANHDVSPLKSSTGHNSEEEEVEELYRDSDTSLDDKKMRIRSLFTEEQQAYLKSQYLLNPRPSKYELIRIGNKIGFPKRVVQNWFQNMRARKMKQRRDVAFNMAILKPDQWERDISKSPTYIPNVPKLSTVLSLPGQEKPSHMFDPSPQSRGTAETPLDLTMHPTRPLAHRGNLSRHSTPDNTCDDQVLNLSTKKDYDLKERSVEKTINKEPSSEAEKPSGGAKSLQDSAIFKYKQQEGMILNKPFSADPSAFVSLSLAHSIQNQLIQQSVASIVRAPYHPATPTTTPDVKASNNTSNSNSVLFDVSNESNPHISKSEILNCPRLVIGEASSEATTHMSGKDNSSPYSHDLTGVTTTDSHAMKLMQEDTHNLAILAEAAQHAANLLCGKPKRLR